MDASAIAAWVSVPVALAGVLVAIFFSSRQVRLARLQNLSPVIWKLSVRLERQSGSKHATGL